MVDNVPLISDGPVIIKVKRFNRHCSDLHHMPHHNDHRDKEKIYQ